MPSSTNGSSKGEPSRPPPLPTPTASVAISHGFQSMWQYQCTQLCVCIYAFAAGYANLVSIIRDKTFTSLMIAQTVHIARCLGADGDFCDPPLPQVAEGTNPGAAAAPKSGLTALWLFAVLASFAFGKLSFGVLNEISRRPFLWAGLIYGLATALKFFADLSSKEDKPTVDIDLHLFVVPLRKGVLLPLLSFAFGLQDASIRATPILSLIHI